MKNDFSKIRDFSGKGAVFVIHVYEIIGFIDLKEANVLCVYEVLIVTEIPPMARLLQADN